MRQQLRLFDIGQKGNNLRQRGHVMAIAIRHQSKADPSHYTTILAKPFRHHPPLLRKQFLNHSTISIFNPATQFTIQGFFLKTQNKKSSHLNRRYHNKIKKWHLTVVRCHFTQ